MTAPREDGSTGERGTGGSPSSGGRPPAGLCASCRHARRIETDRGSVFLLCGRSRSDPRYARYPRLPVWRCPGHEPAAAEPAAGEER